MSKQEIISAIAVLTDIVKANGEMMVSLSTADMANEKIRELIKQL